uniref:Uncharacterized protein n=1 Tax=Lactuca sativa TaxID=4236 RepID=A0A9R1VR48_LACSA|nr:hypothetical protein LSAT_V11C400163970 [Lactuca sativa]
MGLTSPTTPSVAASNNLHSIAISILEPLNHHLFLQALRIWTQTITTHKNVFVQCTKLPSTKNIRFIVTTTNDIKSPQPTINSTRRPPTTPSTTMDQQTTTNMESFTPTKSCETGKCLQLEHPDTTQKTSCPK